MTAFSDAELYLRGAATLVASWEAYARYATGAAVVRLPGVAAAVFPREPERTWYNNALLDRDLPAPARTVALDAMEAAYRAAGVARFAAWTHEGDLPLHSDLENRGYVQDGSTRAMGMALSDLRLARPAIELDTPDWSEYLHLIGLPPDFLPGADPDTFRLRIARRGGANVAAAMAFDHGTDCGIFNVVTLAHARRRGLGSALTALHLHDARARGCRTASLQSTLMAERVYAAAGFRDLGCNIEYVPKQSWPSIDSQDQ